MAVNEALASGLPAIVTPNAGAIVRDGVEGFVVPIRDVSALAERMVQLADDVPLRRRMGAAARALAEAHDTAAYARRLQKLLDHVRPAAQPTAG
jgi:glycosyltransferase involved in cell wall biosynthesis